MARPQPNDLTLWNRFWRSVRFADGDACWVWERALNPQTGYGVLNWRGKTRTAHRLSYEFYKGDPGELHVLHKCDNRMCVNPEHLFLGTNLDNIIDSMKKGRRKRPRQMKINRQKKEAA